MEERSLIASSNVINSLSSDGMVRLSTNEHAQFEALVKTISMLATMKVMMIQVKVTIRWNMVNQIFNLIIYETIQFHTEQLQNNNCAVQFNRKGKLSK